MFWVLFLWRWWFGSGSRLGLCSFGSFFGRGGGLSTSSKLIITEFFQVLLFSGDNNDRSPNRNGITNFVNLRDKSFLIDFETNSSLVSLDLCDCITWLNLLTFGLEPLYYFAFGHGRWKSRHLKNIRWNKVLLGLRALGGMRRHIAGLKGVWRILVWKCWRAWYYYEGSMVLLLWMSLERLLRRFSELCLPEI